MSRVSVQVELLDSMSTSPDCSAVKRCWPDSGTYFTFSESPKMRGGDGAADVDVEPGPLALAVGRA